MSLLTTLSSSPSSWTEANWIVAGVAFNDAWVPLYVLYNLMNNIGADYGRYSSAVKSGGGLDPRLFWVLMEIPNLIGASIVIYGDYTSTSKDHESISNPGFWL